MTDPATVPLIANPVVAWAGIALCVSQSAMFSGLNLALFGISRLELEIEVEHGNKQAKRILALRRDSNFLLTTILWGNVAVNVLLALLTDSVLSGIAGFLFSTIAITLFGEIGPQAYFSRHALRMGSILAPLVRFYQFLLFPVAKPTALVLDATLGPEGIEYLKEGHLRDLIKRHMHAEEADLDHHEGLGALNFLVLDDLPIKEEGEVIDPRSVIGFPTTVDLPVIPAVKPTADDPFIKSVQASGRKWVIITNEESFPALVLDADAFLREALFSTQETLDPYKHCFRPLVTTDPNMPIGTCLKQLRVQAKHADDDVIDRDLILLWAPEERRIMTGADILGRLLRGIVRAEHQISHKLITAGPQQEVGET